MNEDFRIEVPIYGEAATSAQIRVKQGKAAPR